MKEEKRTIRVGLLGIGTVGSGVAAVLKENADIIRDRCTEIKLTHIVNRDQAKAQKVIDELGLTGVKWSADYHALIEDDSLDILVEVAGGIPMPKDFIIKALQHGKTVVTANKDLMAAHGHELMEIAEENGVDIFFEASVCGGIPILQAMKESLAGNRFKQVIGILNGTTNYILTAMSQKGQGFEEALAEATRLGYAEADPTNDVENYDAGRKIAILASMAFNSRVTDAEVATEGITKISKWDILYAKEFGYEITSVGIAKCEDGDIEVRVHPVMLPQSHPLATVADSYNAVFVEGNALEKAMFYGRGAGAYPTASAVVGDLINASRNILHHCANRWGCTCYLQRRIKPMAETVSKYYVRMNVLDQPGVLAAITDKLGINGVSLDAVIQKRRLEDGKAEIVMITHMVKHANLMQAMTDIANLSCVSTLASIIRVEGNDDEC